MSSKPRLHVKDIVNHARQVCISCAGEAFAAYVDDSGKLNVYGSSLFDAALTNVKVLAAISKYFSDCNPTFGIEDQRLPRARCRQRMMSLRRADMPQGLEFVCA